ncbi:MAG TPA: nuclear transport factor 2 family protein [Stellaceae bacterium]|jgi:ketosteroid isomerase-like protein|nr:nuclear transport factor 2 family protein [Stellaceae bacterium]
MTDRNQIDRLLRGLYDARARGDLNAVCAAFTDDAAFQIAGASNASPIAITAHGIAEFRPWLTLMLKTFQLDEVQILRLIVDGDNAAGHWQARIHSRVTGAKVLTELVDIIQVRDGRISSYTEFFVPR